MRIAFKRTLICSRVYSEKCVPRTNSAAGLNLPRESFMYLDCSYLGFATARNFPES